MMPLNHILRKCTASNEKWQMEGVELPNQVIRMLREKETYKYLVILEADTTKQQ